MCLPGTVCIHILFQDAFLAFSFVLVPSEQMFCNVPARIGKKFLPVQVTYAQMFPCKLHSSCVLLITFAVGKKCCHLQPVLQQWGFSSRVCVTKNSSVRLSLLLVIFVFLFFLNIEVETLFFGVYLLFRKIDSIYSCYHMIIRRFSSVKSSKQFPCQ